MKVFLEIEGVENSCSIAIESILHTDRSTGFVIEVYDEIVAPLFAYYTASVENISVLNAADSFRGSDTFIIIGKREVGGAFCGSCKSSSVCPSEGVLSSVVVGKGIAYRVIGYCRAVEGGEPVAPMLIAF